MEYRSYVLIEAAMERCREVIKAMQGCDWLESAERLTGPYDIVATIHAHAVRELDDVVNDGIRALDGVIRVVVCPISPVFDAATPM